MGFKESELRGRVSIMLTHMTTIAFVSSPILSSWHITAGCGSVDVFMGSKLRTVNTGKYGVDLFTGSTYN